jgi:hypothetical protein
MLTLHDHGGKFDIGKEKMIEPSHRRAIEPVSNRAAWPGLGRPDQSFFR